MLRYNVIIFFHAEHSGRSLEATAYAAAIYKNAIDAA